ncbi:PAS domain S-box protein [Candidatus Symbiobacter mobilis]|uniref:PAS/PAC domain protein n=1 Tax=Candidatus Symbiobacter mobilis CR TaxID=946483 RepID=U5NBU1_9BURK|nr:PAS domain S-box protein [Candidatus Symbiobacter mobilis]AGX87713.1 PAS/PAC domain protein [Candidatus Symbiobacter mobilis CR]
MRIFFGSGRLRDRIRVGLGVLIALLVANALVASVATVVLVRQLHSQRQIDAILVGIEKVRVHTALYADTSDRSGAQRVFTELDALAQGVRAADPGQQDPQWTGMLPVLDDFRLHFQKYVVEADQLAALRSRTNLLGKRMAEHLHRGREADSDRLDDIAFDTAHTALLQLLWAGQALQADPGHPSAQALQNLREAMERLRAYNHRVSGHPERDLLLFRLHRDAATYVDVLESFVRFHNARAETQHTLSWLSNMLEQRSARIQSDVVAALRRQLSLTVGLMAAILLLSIASAALFSRSLSRAILLPLQALVRTTRAIAAGRLDARAPVTDDEVGELARSFNTMTRTLLETQSALSAKNEVMTQAQQELEARVQERTEQLARANDALRAEIDERTRAQLHAERAHQALLTRETLTRQITDTAPVGIFLMDETGRIVQANRSMTELFGHPMDALLGREYLSLVTPTELARRPLQLLSMVRGEVPYVQIDRKFVRKDGSEFWANVIGRPLCDPTGQAHGFVVVISDISDRKRVEEQLALVASVFTAMREGILIADARARIVECNEALARVTGYSRSDMLQQPLRRFRSLRHTRRFYSLLWRTLCQDGHWAGECWIRGNNQTECLHWWTITAVRDDDGAIVRFVALCSEVPPARQQTAIPWRGAGRATALRC